MIRLAASATIAVLANAIALIAGAVILDDMSLDGVGFVVAVVLFTVTAMLIEPLLRQMAIKNVPALLGSSALLSTLVSLIITSLVSDHLTIRGATTWVLATIIVWGVALAARLLLPLLIFKQALANARSGRGNG